ncbi:hypothetical protein GCM10007858_54450 [Bradyrhizobium liaoningense]|nr:hypothetical protein GCM10007858_54450 [Bradyrhizobium liaoningense]
MNGVIAPIKNWIADGRDAVTGSIERIGKASYAGNWVMTE